MSSASYTHYERNDTSFDSADSKFTRRDWPDEAWFTGQNYLDVQDVLNDAQTLQEEVQELDGEADYTQSIDYTEVSAEKVNIQFEVMEDLVTDIRNDLKKLFKRLTNLIRTYYSDKRTWFNKGRRSISYLTKSDDPKQQQDAVMKNLEARRLCLFSYINILTNDQIGRGESYFTTMKQFVSNLNLFMNWLADSLDAMSKQMVV